MADRRVDVADAFGWLPTVTGLGPVVAYPPERIDLDPATQEYGLFYMGVVDACMEAAGPNPFVLFTVDRLAQGRWWSKEHLFGSEGLVWHRIYLTQAVGSVNLRRPTYTHGYAFGARPGKRRPDVVLATTRNWERGLQVEAAADAIDWLAEVAPAGPIINPFCGKGTILKAANDTGRDAYGCDTDGDRVAAAIHA